MVSESSRITQSLGAIVSVPTEELVARSKVRLEILVDLDALHDNLARAITSESAQGNAAAVPASWLLLFMCWFGYYVTYPTDEARLRAAMAERRTQIEGES